MCIFCNANDAKLKLNYKLKLKLKLNLKLNLKLRCMFCISSVENFVENTGRHRVKRGKRGLTAAV